MSGQPLSELAEQHVTIVVAEGVVDLFESIEIQQHHRERFTIEFRRFHIFA